MMASDPWDMPGLPPLPRRVPVATVEQVIDLLRAEPPGSLVRLLAGGQEAYAKGIVKTDRNGHVVIC